jgi:hypothetical protein
VCIVIDIKVYVAVMFGNVLRSSVLFSEFMGRSFCALIFIPGLFSLFSLSVFLL